VASKPRFTANAPSIRADDALRQFSFQECGKRFP